MREQSLIDVFLFAAGYNHLEVVEYLLDEGADVNARDKGGLIPLHNASSFGVSLNRHLLLLLNSSNNAETGRLTAV